MPINTNYFDFIPDETFLQIVSNLGESDQLSLSMVDRRFSGIIDRVVVIQTWLLKNFPLDHALKPADSSLEEYYGKVSKLNYQIPQALKEGFDDLKTKLFKDPEFKVWLRELGSTLFRDIASFSIAFYVLNYFEMPRPQTEVYIMVYIFAHVILMEVQLIAIFSSGQALCDCVKQSYNLTSTAAKPLYNRLWYWYKAQ